MELHHPLYQNFDNSPTHTTPKISIHVCETIRYRVSIDYM